MADPAALQRAADQVTPQLVEHLALRWLRQVPDPLTREERGAGYPLRFSIYQAEFSDNVVFKQTQVLNRVYEALLRDHLHLGRPGMLLRARAAAADAGGDPPRSGPERP